MCGSGTWQEGLCLDLLSAMCSSHAINIFLIQQLYCVFNSMISNLSTSRPKRMKERKRIEQKPQNSDPSIDRREIDEGIINSTDCFIIQIYIPRRFRSSKNSVRVSKRQRHDARKSCRDLVVLIYSIILEERRFS